MKIKQLSLDEFETFAKNHIYSNFHQTINYALLKTEEGYSYEFIGYGNDDEIVAASLILTKPIADVYYGYAPRGFLIDYSNRELLKDFTIAVKDYYRDRDFAFIKVNPEIAISRLNKKTGNFEYNDNYQLIEDLRLLEYKKLKNNMYFEALLPRVNAIVNLEKFSPDDMAKNTRNKVKKGLRKGLTLEFGGIDKLPVFYNFIKNKRNKDEFYYNDLYNAFSKNDSIDLLLVKIDYKQFLINSQNQYEYELSKNADLNNILMHNNSSSTINRKMNSDKALLSYKNDIAEASKSLNQLTDTYVAGALVIKHNNRITIQISGFDKSFSRFSPNYYLYFAILAYYKDNYKYADLNGVSGNLDKDSKYYGLNRFKLGFNPSVYEYIGEFDLIINENYYNELLRMGLLAEEFNK